MARPIAADADATRARILSAACALVADRGIDGTSIRDIAKGSSVSLATVLHYYGSKDGLYDACIASMYQELNALAATLLAAITPGASPRLVLEQSVRASNRFAKAHRAAHRLLLRANIDEAGMRADRREQYLGAALDTVADVLAQFLGVDTRHARLVHSSIVHLVVRYALQSTPELCLITGAKNAADAEAAIEDHLVELAHTLLRVPLQIGERSPQTQTHGTRA